MWVSVLRAKVKSVAGVVEVGRIRVTDQRAPREPVPGKSLRRLRRGPSVSSRARIASKTRVRCTRLSACLFVFLPSFVLFLLSFVIFLSPFAPLLLTGPSRFLLSVPRAFLSFSLRDHPASSFALVLSFAYRACTAFHPLPLFKRYAFYYIPLSSLLSSLLPLLNSFSLFSSHRSFSLVRSLLVPLSLATYPPDYLVLGTGYSVLRTRYPVYSLATTIEHTATERRHPEATAFVPFVLVRLLLPLQASWGILRLFVSVSRRRNAWDQDTPRAHALYLLFFFFFLFLLFFLTSSTSSSSCYRLLVASLRESSSSHLSIRLLFEKQVRKRTCLFVRMT